MKSVPFFWISAQSGAGGAVEALLYVFFDYAEDVMLVKQNQPQKNSVAGEGQPVGVWVNSVQAKRDAAVMDKKTATDMGTSVAVSKSNQKIWLNCCAETRP